MPEDRPMKVQPLKPEVKRSLLHAAVNNLIDLPPDHPAFEKSLTLVTDFQREQKARWDADLGG